ncbi:hypothetical protein [Bacillus sp. MRMR6]|uniref:hypothetical protein n=1 Tax=Bacillus sp. MRMR6 TaxID=1928617 RepID=UPI000AA9C768|nr:hypothetical protein [Bacillus sp. MRMR6]
MFVVVMFLGVLMPIVGFVVLVMLRLLDEELDVLELENIKVRLEKEETKGGKKVVGRAIIFSLLVVGVLFIIQTWVAALIWPDYTTFENADVAFYQIAEVAGGPWLKWTTILATALAWGIADALVAQAAADSL